MVSRPGPSVVLYSGPDALPGIDRILGRAGVRLVRIRSWRPQPIAPARWLPRLTRFPQADTVIVTSRTAVTAGVRPWHRLLGRFPVRLEFWAVGPGTARTLRAAGAKRVRRPSSVGSEGVLDTFRGRRGRKIVYLRSDLAGPRLARALRRCGHTVVDVVVYRTGAPSALAPSERKALLRGRLLVVTSPSGLSHLRAGLGAQDFGQVARTVPLVVLGERSRGAARRQRFRRVSVAPSTTPQRFTRHLLRVLNHDSA